MESVHTFYGIGKKDREGTAWTFSAATLEQGDDGDSSKACGTDESITIAVSDLVHDPIPQGFCGSPLSDQQIYKVQYKATRISRRFAAVHTFYGIGKKNREGTAWTFSAATLEQGDDGDSSKACGTDESITIAVSDLVHDPIPQGFCGSPLSDQQIYKVQYRQTKEKKTGGARRSSRSH